MRSVMWNRVKTEEKNITKKIQTLEMTVCNNDDLWETVFGISDLVANRENGQGMM